MWRVPTRFGRSSPSIGTLPCSAPVVIRARERHEVDDVEITAALAADLDVLAVALDDPALDLQTHLHHLVADVRMAVHSYLGLTMTVRAGGSQLHVAVWEDGARQEDARSSLMVTLPAVERLGIAEAGELLLYAGKSGAFVDMAADLSWLTGKHLTDFVLDEHLSAVDAAGKLPDVAASSTINQAIGVLLGAGFTAADAVVELDRRAVDAGTDRVWSATQLLAALPLGDGGATFIT